MTGQSHGMYETARFVSPRRSTSPSALPKGNRPHSYGLGIRDNPPFRGNFIERLYEKKVSLLAETKLNLLFLVWVSFIYSISVGFAEFISVAFVMQICALKPKISENTCHSGRRELSQVGKPKCLYEKKLSLPGLPYLPGRDNSPTRVVSPPERTIIYTVDGIFQRFSEKLARPG